jgi:ribosomal protein S6
MEKNDMNNDKMKVYELGYLLVPSIAEEHVAGEVEAIKAVLSKVEASIITEDSPKLRPLAYEMTKVIGSKRDKYDTGYFGWIKFEVAGSVAPLIKTQLDKNPHILRFMVINTVRENTFIGQKVIFKDEVAKETTGAEEEPKVSEEELDKTIENLVVE